MAKPSVETACPRCRFPHAFMSNWVGKQVHCQSCQTPFVVTGTSGPVNDNSATGLSPLSRARNQPTRLKRRKRRPVRRQPRHTAFGLPPAYLVGVVTNVAMWISIVGFGATLVWAVITVIYTKRTDRELAAAVLAPIVASAFAGMVAVVFWSGLVGTLLRMEDRLTEIAEKQGDSGAQED